MVAKGDNQTLHATSNKMFLGHLFPVFQNSDLYGEKQDKGENYYDIS